MGNSDPWLEKYATFLNRFVGGNENDAEVAKQDLDLDSQDEVKPDTGVVNQLPNTNILIDFWQAYGDEEKFIRFMTVFPDEERQLEDIKRSNYKIYTSYLNKRFLEFSEVPPDRIVAIEPRSCVEIQNKDAGYSFRVSTIESNYSAGSCMLLFQGPFGNILYTEFFRLNKLCDPLQDPNLEPLILNKLITEVYIDNTCAAEHCQFPSRTGVILRIVQLIKEHPHHKIIISGDKTEKKEIFPHLNILFDKNIGIPESGHKELLIFMQQSGVKVDAHEVDRNIIVEDELLTLEQCKEKLAEEELCIIILLTADYICAEKIKATPVPQLSNVHILPYSSHASHNELMYFLYNVRAGAVKPIILTKSVNNTIPQNMVDVGHTDGDQLIFQNSSYYEYFLSTKNSSSDTHRFPVQRKWDNSIYADMNTTSLTERKGYNQEPQDIYEQSDVAHNSSTHGNNAEIESIFFPESESMVFMTSPEVQDIDGIKTDNDDMEYTSPETFFTSNSNDVGIESITERSEDDVTNGFVSQNIDSVIWRTPYSSRDRQPSLNSDTFIREKSTDTSRGLRMDNSSQSHALSCNEMLCDETSSDNENMMEMNSSGTFVSEHSQISFEENKVHCKTKAKASETHNMKPIKPTITTDSDESRELTDVSSLVTQEPSDNEDEQLTAVLYHTWLVNDPEFWQKTNLTIDSWKDLDGMDLL